MWRKFQDSRAAKAQEERSKAAHANAERLAVIANRTYEAWQAAKLDGPVSRVPGVQLKSGEVAYLVLEGVGLVEPRRAPGQWVGGSQGVSFRVMKGVNYRVGQSKGTYAQGEERPQIVDQGLGVVTSQRMVFVGGKRSMEWAYSKLLGFSLEFDSMAIFNVSNRQKASGFAYQREADHIVDAVVAAAVAKFTSPEEHEAVVTNLLAQYSEAYGAWSAATGGPSPAITPSP